MSPLGQSRHSDRVTITSGLPLKQTFSESVGMSQRCHERTPVMRSQQINPIDRAAL
jgi:hypothetical protein